MLLFFQFSNTYRSGFVTAPPFGLQFSITNGSSWDQILSLRLNFLSPIFNHKLFLGSDFVIAPQFFLSFIFNHKLFFLGSSFAIAGANQSHPTTHTRITESHLTPCFRLTGQILPVSSSVSKPSSIVAEKVSDEQTGHRPVSLHTAEPSRLLPSHSPCELFRPRRFQRLVLFLHTSAQGLPRKDSTDTRGSPPRSSREITCANWPDEF